MRLHSVKDFLVEKFDFSMGDFFLSSIEASHFLKRICSSFLLNHCDIKSFRDLLKNHLSQCQDNERKLMIKLKITLKSPQVLDYPRITWHCHHHFRTLINVAKSGAVF